MVQDLAQVIEGILADLADGRWVEEHKAALKAYGVQACEALLGHLRDPDPRRVKAAFFGLQFCYARQAYPVLREYLGSAEARIREHAAIVLGRNEGVQELARCCLELLEHPDPGVAAFALRYVDEYLPDPRRAAASLANPLLAPALWRSLPRYGAPAFRAATYRLLEHPDPDVCYAACVALIQQQDRSAALREVMRNWLTLRPAETRELAAEYFTWHGGPEVVPDLLQALGREEDLYTAAALRAALACVSRRVSLDVSAEGAAAAGSWTAAGAGTAAVRSGSVSQAGGGAEEPDFARRLGLAGPDLAEAYGRARAMLEQAPRDGALREGLRSWFAVAQQMEPRWEYSGAEPAPGFAAERQAWCRLRSALYGLPGPSGESEEYLGALESPVTTALIPPVRNYFNPERRSFGNRVGEEIAAFGNLVHVGDDVHWYKDHRTVVAIAPGVVRQAGCVSSWGYLVVVEHRTKGGARFCSLYAHLDSGLQVRPGTLVAQGEKLGVVGRGYSWANGGYAAHLHFAIHRGPYRQTLRVGASEDVRYQGRLYRGVVLHSDFAQTVLTVRRAGGSLLLVKPTSWIRGYISPWAWKEFAHEWSDPPGLIGKYLPEGWRGERPGL